MRQKIIFYGHNFCPQVHTVRAALDQIGLGYDYIDIRKDDAGRERVREINAGYESVPTLVFSDGSTLTEPSEDVLYAHLDGLGLRLDPPSGVVKYLLYMRNPIVPAFGVGVVIGGALFGSSLVMGVGIFLVLIPWVIRLF